MKYEHEVEFRGFIDMIEFIQTHPGFTIFGLLSSIYVYMLIVAIFKKDNNTPEC